MPSLTFHGAAGGQVTGSMYLVEAAGARFLVDGGLFQGNRAEARKLNAELPFDPRRLDWVLVTHAHIDHTGRLPLLVKEGFHGPIYATPATRDLCAVMLADSAHIQESDFEWVKRHGKAAPESEPLYTGEDAIAVQKLFVGVPYRRPIHLRKMLTAEFYEAGHILGSASIDLRLTEGRPQRIVFSGDIGRVGLPIIRDPDPPTGPVDTLIIEATYGNRTHSDVKQSEDELGELISKVAKRGGKVIIPAFAVGRTQELVYGIHQLYRAGKIPEIPIYIDSPLAVDVTDVFRMHPEVFDRHEPLVNDGVNLFDFPLVHYVRSVEESKALNGLHGPAVIISASGMAENGRILHHLRNNVGDPRNLVLFVGYNAVNTLGRRIEEGQKQVQIFGDPTEIRCEVASLGGYSGHADRNEIRGWLRKLGGPVRRAFIVHGETEGVEGMAQLLREEGVQDVVEPKLGETYEL
jgi:metallo-beta-lactamase family protein